MRDHCIHRKPRPELWQLSAQLACMPASRACIVRLVMASSTIVSPLGTQRYAIFCLFRMGAEVFDTDMVIVDQTVTDICFDNVTIL